MKEFTVEPLLLSGEDVDGWRTRVMEAGSFKLSFSLKEAPLVFKRR
jgi:hypothetical protein